MESRFDVGDQVTNKSGAVGVIVDKRISEAARLVGETKYRYQVKGPGFDPDQWYAETSLMPVD